jgi:N-acetylglucosaminyl-diphospho-decaprenol L-rhamnosyltransferase
MRRSPTRSGPSAKVWRFAAIYRPRSGVTYSECPQANENKPQLPDVSVVIVSWNAKDLTDQALRSLNAHNASDDLEVIVVDNNSEDDTAEHLRREWPQVKLVRPGENTGFSRGNNIGFGHARGRYVLLLNSDTIVLPTTVSGLVRHLDAEPSVGCVGARHLNPDMSLQWSVDDFPNLPNDFLHYTDLYRLPFLQSWLARRWPRWTAHNEERDVDWVNGACMMVRREVIEQTGGFDESFFIFAEELDWCRRIWDAGWRVRFIPDAELIHIQGGTFTNANGHRRLMIYQSSLRYYRKHKTRAEQIGLRVVIVANAIVRLPLIAGLGVARKAGVRRTDPLWLTLTQDNVAPNTSVAIRTWLKTLWLSADEPIRP